MESAHFRDFDEFVASVRGVDCTMMLQNAAQHRWDIQAAEVTGIRVQLGRLGSGNMLEGQSWPDGTLIYLPLSETCEYLAWGTVIEKNAFMILEPGCEFSLSTKIEHNWCSIFIPTRVLDLGRDLAAREAESDRTCRLTYPNRLLAGQFSALVDHTLSMASRHPEFESSVASKAVAEQLQNLGALIVRGERSSATEHAGRTRLPREEIIHRAKALLEEREGEHLLMSELAAAAGVSERTLRSAFHEYYGIGPLRYLQVRNAHRVYRALRKAEPGETRVARVLLEHGETEFGRFAQRYRRLFGELPSETLRKTHRRAG